MRIVRALAVTTVGLLSLAGCATGSTAGSGATSSSTGKTDQIAVTIANGKVSPAPHAVQIKAGDNVDLKVTSDKADEVHVHGVNIERPVGAGQTLELTFVVKDPGVYEVETHKSGLTLLKIEAR